MVYKLITLLAIGLTIVSPHANAMYSGSDVIELNPDTFKSRVTDSSDVWIIEFYAPWCGHCKALTPEYKKAAKALKGIAKVAAVNADEHKQLGAEFGVRGFPTIKVFGINKQKPTDYEGDRTAKGIAEAGLQALRKVVNARLGGSTSDSSSGSKSSSKDVIELTDENFAKNVLNSKDIWFVEFFAPWCGHCQRLAPVWSEVATELKGKAKVAALDATVHTNIASQYGIKGFPTLKLFVNGEVINYEDSRSKDDMVKFVLEQKAKHAAPPEVYELVNDASFKKACDASQLCIISFLPHILDCNAACRNAYLKTLKEVAERFKSNQWGYLWAEAVQQPDLEESVGVGGFGYPALVAVNTRKAKYSLMRGSFSTDGIKEFLRDLSYGKGTSFSVKGAQLPKIVKSEPWDGKDGQLPVSEDSDHSEL